jgi:outer membrane immunogenic protein
VVGLEGDVAWSNNTATVAGIPGCTMQCFPGAPGPGVNVSSVKVGWDASLRARLGHMIAPDLLIYGTGGVAWQEIVSSGTCQHSLPNPQCTVAAGNPFDTQTNQNIFTGWTVGGGIEKMYGNWMLRAEYRFSQFGNANDVLPFSASIAVGTDFSRYKLSVQTHIATVGLAYKFGGP